MSRSMFGPPSQHLLPSVPPASPASTSLASDLHPEAPVQPPPVSFKDFRFNSIGKRPELLNRISLSQPDQSGYHSSTPSPISTPPALTTDAASQSKSSSRPTLFQQLAGNNFTMSMNENPSTHPSTSQSNRSLASRIQMHTNPPNDIVGAMHSTASRYPSPPLRVDSIRRAAEDVSLIPPVEVLSQLSDSSSSTPAPSAPALAQPGIHSATFHGPSINTMNSRTSTPPVTTKTISRESAEPSSYFAVIDAMMQGLQPPPSTAVITNPLVTQQERLQTISVNLANLAPPLPTSSLQSPSPVPSNSQANDNTTPHQSSQSQHNSTPVFLLRPHSTNHSSSQAGLSSSSDVPMNSDDSSSTLVPSPITIAQEHQTQRKTVLEAVQNLNSALNAVHRAQIESENALAFQIRTFSEQRLAFEQTKRADEAIFSREFCKLQHEREELNAKEASLASLVQENEAREVARNAMFAKRQAQEEERRIAETKRMQEVQEQIAAGVAELKELEALRVKGQFGQLASETVPADLPFEPQEGMDEEEVAAIKTRSDLLRALKHLRRMHTDKVQQLEESNRTLRGLEERRKQRETEEAEHRRIAEEERLRTHAEAERARQAQDVNQHRSETEKRPRETVNDREQQNHAEAQAHGSKSTKVTSDLKLEHLNRQGEADLSQQQSPAEMTRFRGTPGAIPLSMSSEVTTSMSVDGDENLLTRHRTVPPSASGTDPGSAQSTTSQSKQVRPTSGGVMLAPSVHRAIPSSTSGTASGGTQSTTSQSKQDGPISGGVTLAAPASKVGAAHLPAKPLAKPPPYSASDRMAESVVNPVVSVSVGSARGPTQLASEFNRVASADICSSSDHNPTILRTPKSRTLLDASMGASEEFNIGPVTGLSPTQRNVNLRHLKRYHSRIEENDSGDRSVRTSLKPEETPSVSVKREEHDDQSREFVQTSLPISPLASLPPRPTLIAPPRPRKRHAAPHKSQLHPSNSHPENNASSSSRREAIAGLPSREVVSPDNPNPRITDTPIQPPVPAETVRSNFLGPVHAEPQTIESRASTGERPNRDHTENYDGTLTGSTAVAAQPYEMDGVDRSRSKRRSTDELRKARDLGDTRRMSDRYSPSFHASRSPTQSHRQIDPWRPQNPFSGPRAEPMHATSPTTGRKRPFAFNNDEHDHRARRLRGDVWVAQDYDRDRVDSYRPRWDRHLNSEPDDRRVTYRAPVSSPEYSQSYASDVPMAIYDDRTSIPQFNEESTAPLSREQSYRKPEVEDTFQRHQPSPPGYNTMTDDVRAGETYEPMTEERIDVQSDPSLLARMSNTQRFLPSSNTRGRGRGEPNRGRGDIGRGRGRGAARGGPALLDRLTSGPPLPSSLERRLT